MVSVARKEWADRFLPGKVCVKFVLACGAERPGKVAFKRSIEERCNLTCPLEGSCPCRWGDGGGVGVGLFPVVLHGTRSVFISLGLVLRNACA